MSTCLLTVCSWKKRIDESQKELKDPVKTLYPDVPEERIPSPFKTSELAGSYTDAGYGTFTFREESRNDKTVLYAHRKDLELGPSATLEHVSGNYWIMKVLTYLNPTLMPAHFAVEFTRGPDGKVAALEVDWSSQSRSDGKSVFRRM